MPANSLKKEQVCIKSLLLIEFDRSALTFGFGQIKSFFCLAHNIIIDIDKTLSHLCEAAL